MELYIGSKYKVTSKELYSYVDTESSTYDDISFGEWKSKNVSIYDGGALLLMIAEHLKDEELIEFGTKDNEMIFEFYNPSGATSTVTWTIERLEN